MGRFIPGKGYIKGFTQDTIPAIGYTTSRDTITNPNGRPIIRSGYLESSSEFPLIGSGYTFIQQPSTGPTAVDDNYDAIDGVQLVVTAELGILANDTYECI